MAFGAKLTVSINAVISKILSLDGRSVDYSFGLNDGTAQLTPNGKIVFGNGTGAGNVNAEFILPGTTAAGVTTQVNLNDGSVLDIGGAPLILTKVKFLYLSLESAGSLIFGPQGLTNAVQLNFNGVTSNDKLTVSNAHMIVDSTGWTIDSTHKILGLNNPGGSTVTWVLVGVGES